MVPLASVCPPAKWGQVCQLCLYLKIVLGLQSETFEAHTPTQTVSVP